MLLCAVLYFWRLGLTPLEDFDEAYYAAGAREMLARGNLGTPYYNGAPFLLKPILIYWIIAASFRFLGTTEFAARAPSAFLGTAIVLLTYWFAAKTLNRRAAFLAGLALALNYMWIDIARDASIDIPLTAAVTPAMFLFFLAPQAPPDRRRWLYLAAYPLFGAALLAKGPVPTGVVGVGLLAYLIATRRLKTTRREGQLLPGLVLMLAVAAPWYVYELRLHPEFWRIFFIGEHFGHIGGQLARTEPWWGNLRYLLVFFLPWAAFLPAAYLHALRRGTVRCAPAASDDGSDEGTACCAPTRFCAWWSLAVIVLFSIPKSKLAHYLAPAFPPLAILVGAWLDVWLTPVGPTSSRTRSTVFPFALLGLVGAAVAAGAVIAVTLPPFAVRALARYDGWTPGIAPAIMLGALAVSFLAAAVAARWRRSVVVPALAAGMLVAGLVHVGWFKERWSLIQAQPRKNLAVYAAATLPADEPFGVYYAKRNSTIFYLKRPLVDLGEWDPKELVAFLSSPRPVTALTHEKVLAELTKAHCRFRVVKQDGAYVLVANHL